ncbi:MAG: hypothetical protein COX13_04760, partial [Caldiserica bacterium CG23_combo_of_CG06-09_8_20_14_all_35_60]
MRDRAPNLNKCATSFDIVGIQQITIDIDPFRSTEIPSTDEEAKNAIKIAQIISDWFERNKFKKPSIAMTGNGTCLYF